MDYASDRTVLGTQTIMSPEKTTGAYLYCLIEGSAPIQFPFEGIGGGRVYTVQEQDIAAVISDTEAMDFDRFDQQELLRFGAMHQKVIESFFKEYDVVPFSFGMIAPSCEEIRRLLRNVYLQFKVALQKIKGKAEFVVHIFWDKQKILNGLLETRPDIQKLRDEVSKKGTLRGMHAKIKLGKFLYEGVEAERRACLEHICAFLKDLVHESTSNKMIDDQMIANLSFLVEKSKEAELDSRMAELGKQYEGKLRFKYIGPMPPYSFARMNLSLGNFELIDEARRTLNLGEGVSAVEIKQAYHMLARQYHPDLHTSTPEIEEKIKKINEAYEILQEYCRSCDVLKEPPSNPRSRYSFQQADVQNIFVMR